MTIYEKNISLLEAFGIPKNGDVASHDSADDVRRILARLLAARSLRLSHLQTARDIYERAGVDEPRFYLFLAALFISSAKGNAYMEVGQMTGLLVDGGHLDDAKKAGCEDDAPYENSIKALTAEVDWGQALSCFENDILVRHDDRWYFKRDSISLEALRNKFSELIAQNKELEDVDGGVLEKAVDFGNFTLNEAQKEALGAVARKRFTVITGGPGTGKTTAVCAILRALLAMHKDWTEKDIALAAPTGRAAQRMSEAILDQSSVLKDERLVEHVVVDDEPRPSIAEKLEGATIHRLLGGYAPNWKHNKNNPLDHKIVIVDETSMADLYLMHALLEALDENTRLVLLGDPDQLPSVDTGAVLGDLTVIGAGKGFVKKLTVCERAKGEISDVAKAINKVETDQKQSYMAGLRDKRISSVDQLSCAGEIEAGKSVFQWLCLEPDANKADLLKIYGKWMSGNELVVKASEIEKTDKCFAGEASEKSKELFKELNRRRILTLVREGWYGVREANAFLLKEAKRVARVNGDYLSMVGVPIIVTHNTPERKLFNGDVGVTVRGPNGMVVLFPRGKNTIACPVALLPEHELAYAMTVHKSQGSEFENVMVVLPNDVNHPLLNRQIVYTGVTRAKKRAVVVGGENVLSAALDRKLVRNTGLSI